MASWANRVGKGGLGRVVWVWLCQLIPPPHRVMQGPLLGGLQCQQEVSV